MSQIPQEKTIDNSLVLLKEGYKYIQNRCERYQSDIFQTRLLGEKVICLHGEEGAKIFYDTEKFQREGAIPAFIKKSLFGENSIQSLDNAPHRNRKEMFMSLMSEGNMQKLMGLVESWWLRYLRKWEQTNDLVVLFEEAQEILCRAACAWAGIPLKEEEVRMRTDDFMARIDSFGAVGPRYLRGYTARIRTEKWVKGIIEQIRSGELEVEESSAAYVFAHHREPAGAGGEAQLFDAHTAAVEVINVVRPFVAIAYYVAFSAHALHRQPEYKQKLREGDDKDLEMFIQEVRRYYPFAPFLGARVRKEFEWRGHHFEEGRLVLLDLYGTMHSPELWDQPEEFRPERFLNWKGSAFDLIPQGGGAHHTGHRCAGEWITIGAAMVSLKVLANMQYEVPRQNLGFSLSRVPTFPRSGFTIRYVKGLNEYSKLNKPMRREEASSPIRMPAADRAACPYHQMKGALGK